MKELNIKQFDVFHFKIQHLIIEYEKYIFKNFERSDHIFYTEGLLPHTLWSVSFTANYVNYTDRYASLFTVIIDSLCQPFGLILSFDVISLHSISSKIFWVN
jgi:hypothetical protein